MTTESLKRDTSNNLKYNHARLESRRNFLRFILRYIAVPLMAKIDSVVGIENIPTQGSAMLMMNHIAFIDPLVMVHVTPRNIVPLSKIEAYRIPFFGIFPKIWQAIPVKRDEVDLYTVKQIFNVLEAGEIILIAPEGTRNKALQKGKEGVAYLASRSAVPIIPVAIEGTQNFVAPRFSKPWRGPGITVKYGPPFQYRAQYRRANRADLRKMTDEAMYILAAMLPEVRRGVYSDLSKASKNTVEWV